MTSPTITLAATSLRPRLSPTLVQLVGAGLSMAASSLLSLSDKTRPMALLGALPMVAAFTYLVLAQRRKPLTIEVGPEGLSIVGYQGRPIVFRPLRAEVRRWVLPSIGSRLGDALVVSGRQGTKEVKFTFVVTDGQSAPREAATSDRADFMLQAEVFRTLCSVLGALETQHSPEEPSEKSFVLVPHRGFKSALSVMLPWLGTMGVVGLIGVAGQPLLETSFGRTLIFGATLVAIALGLYFTFRRAGRPAREYLLRFTPTELALEDHGVTLLALRLSELNWHVEAYTFSSRVGSYTFPVVALSSPAGKLRVGVWDQRADFNTPGAPKGKAPQYLVGAPDFPSLLSQLRAKH